MEEKGSTAVLLGLSVVFGWFNHLSALNSSTTEYVMNIVERTRSAVDLYLVMQIPSPASQTIRVLQNLGIPYVRMCVLMTSEDPQTICLPKYGDNPNFRWNSQYVLSHQIADKTETDCHVMGCNGSDDIVYPINHDSTNHLSRIVMSLMSAAKWNNVLIFHESVFEKNIGSLFDGMAEIGFVVMGTHIIDSIGKQEYQDILDRASSVGDSLQLTVLCKVMCAEVLQAIKKYDNHQKAAKAVYYFAEILVVNTGTSEIFLHELRTSTFLNIAVVTLPPWVSGHDEVTVNCVEEYSSLTQQIHIASETTIGNNSEVTALPKVFQDHLEKHQALAALLWFPVKTLMWDKKGRSLQRVGQIHLSAGQKLTGPLFPNKQFGFNGRQLLVSTLAYYPFVENLSNGSYDGLCFDILRQLAKDMNFTYQLTTSPDLEWGVTDARGNWSGLIGQLQRNDVDLVASALTVLSVREIVMDFTHPFFYDATVLLMTKEDPSLKKWRTYIDPFHWILLTSIGGCLLVVSILAFLLDRISPYRIKVGLQPWSYLDVLWYMYGALIGRGGGRLRDTQVARILVGSWWIFCVVLIATYTGNLVAFLTVTKDFLPFQGVEGMIQQDLYTWGVVGGTSWVTMFQMSSLPVFQAVYAGMVQFNRSDPDVLSMDQDVHIKKVLRGNYVHIGDRSQIQVKMANECSLYTGSSEILPVQYSFGLPNGSPLTKLFSQKIMAMHENGLISYWKRWRWPKRDFCPESLQTYTKIISLADIQSAFYLLGVGCVLALLSILFEVGFSVVKAYKLKNGNNNITM